ncbi:MAG TPA: hypothetical protein VN088_13895 [Nocardioides sp.]|nr:hypothetical protein [Nocardioides sp.]
MRTPWYLRRRWRYLAATALLVDLSVGVVSAGMAIGSGGSGGQTSSGTDRAARTTAATSSAVTVPWSADRATYDPAWSASGDDPQDPNQRLFGNLQVTVAQTTGLTDQGLKVSWTGATPTATGGGQDYLQIMECWGSKGAGPTPQQCQWGAPNPSLSTLVGPNAATRTLATGADADPQQALGPDYTHQPFGQQAQKLVPFWSIGDPGRTSLGWTNDSRQRPPYDAALSNEVTYATTAADGTGQYIVNLQSALSAPYLGCGDPRYTAQGKSCWLVVVPRGDHNVNGADATTAYQNGDTSSPYVSGSPLSASVWQDRIQVPLSFTPTGSTCDLSKTGIDTAGTDLFTMAFSSWQGALCRTDGTGPLFTYAAIGDPSGRTALTAGSPGMDFMASPVDPTQTGGATLAYAPVTANSLVFSYLIDKNYSSNATPEEKATNGTLVGNLRLDPRLVAKMLTQSYRNDTPGDGLGAGATVPAGNPDSVIHDPEFLQLNPLFRDFSPKAAPEGLIVPFGDSDAAAALWSWLRSDTAARNFLAGRADPWGMRINAAYKSLDLATDTTMDSFPKADPSQYRAGDAPPPGYGTLDLLPYASSFADAAVRTVLANAGTRTFWDNTRTPPQYVAKGASQPGTRFEIAVTTSQSAALYGLPTAALVSDAQDGATGVLPTVPSMLTELRSGSVPTGVTGVSTVDASTPVDGGYPLTLRTYAAVNVCGSSLADLSSYAAFLDYAAASGQVAGNDPGDLPAGYAPLSAADRTQTRTVARQLRSEVSDPQCSSHQGAASSPSPTSTPTGSDGGNGGTGGGTGDSVPSDELTAGGPAGTATAPAVVTTNADALPGGITPAAYISPAARWSVLAALCFALPCLVVGPGFLGAARRRKP